ncbi:MAG TPA: shikimate kinase [Allosphingosinicella sp.]|jgi:shikimate kinase
MSEALPRIDRSIVLVGLMGAGKSTVGKRLARRLGLPFVDSDEEIERAADRSVAEIFSDYGEASFRDGERRVIARLIEGAPKVIATGGGAFVDPETRALILGRCIAVWLDADLETLAERVSRRDHRPLIKDCEPLPILKGLADARNPIYAEAHLHVQSQPAPHERAVERIVAALGAWEQRP